MGPPVLAQMGWSLDRGMAGLSPGSWESTLWKLQLAGRVPAQDLGLNRGRGPLLGFLVGAKLPSLRAAPRPCRAGSGKWGSFTPTPGVQLGACFWGQRYINLLGKVPSGQAQPGAGSWELAGGVSRLGGHHVQLPPSMEWP